MGNTKLLFILTCMLSFLFGTPKAFAECSSNFEDIDAACVREKLSNASEIKFLVPNQNEQIRGKTYFFLTENGIPGKFIIRSAFSAKNECSLSLDVTTYAGGTSMSPSGHFGISKQYNAWSTDRTGFDKNSSDDFRLYHNKGKCVFVSSQAKGVFYKKIEPKELIQGRDSLYYAGNFLIFLAVFLVARAVFQDEDRFKAQSKLEEAERDDKKDVPNDIVLKYSRPFFKRYFTPVVSGMKNKKKIRDKYKRKLASAGLTKALSPEDMFAFKLFLIIGFPVLYLGLRAFLEESWPLAAVPVISVLGFFYPDIWLSGKINQRKEELIQNMPFIVDMLALSVEAGLDFMAAIQKVLDKAPPSAMAEEFETLIKDTKIGASRAEGLRQLSWRADCLPISSFTATLIAADAVGASIGPILKTLAAELRQKRSADAEKKGATAATKILFPVMFLIMPAVGIVIMAPILLQLM
ncbi:MAG: type II secretion system F family protein [Bacteriovoracaceae bacterium]|nr:type II secretion system F family protein [Bacteriovoracaceae bacterium]